MTNDEKTDIASSVYCVCVAKIENNEKELKYKTEKDKK